MGLLTKLFRPANNPVSSFGQTDTGRVRSHNEDAFCLLEEQRVFLISDGMGGHNAGEVASRIAVESLVNHFVADAVKAISGKPEEIRHYMIRAFRQTNNLVMEMADTDISLERMGCTLIACFMDHLVLHTCHVGDVRCYIMHNEGIEQVTRDHTYAAEFEQMIQEGNKVEGMAPPRNILTMAIGFPFPYDPEYNMRNIRTGERLLMCSDGLWSMVSDELIYKTVTEASSPETACNMLIRLANDAGGMDNITAVVVFL